MDRQSIIETQNTQFPDVLQAPEGRHGNVEGRNVEGRQRHVEGIKVMELCSSPKQHRPVPHPLQQVGERGYRRLERGGAAGIPWQVNVLTRGFPYSLHLHSCYLSPSNSPILG